MSQILVSIDAPCLILGVETSFESLLGHPSYSLYEKRFDVFIGPCTDCDLLYNVITIAGLFNASADVLVTLHELNGHPRIMLVSSAPCTRIENHPICCLLTLNDPHVLFPVSGLLTTSCGTVGAQANWLCPQSQVGVLARGGICAEVSHVPQPINMRFRAGLQDGTFGGAYALPAAKSCQGFQEEQDKSAERQALTAAALLAVGVGPGEFDGGGRDWSGFGGVGGDWPDWGNSTRLDLVPRLRF